MVIVAPLQLALYTIVVLLGILGNCIVIGVVGENMLQEGSRGPSSDIILLNLALSNLLISLVRNLLLVIVDAGAELYLSLGWCRFFMCIWVWLRCANVWSTFFLSAFHHYTLHRVGPALNHSQGFRELHRVLLGLGLVWAFSLLYSIPGYIYSKNGGRNRTETLMLITTTTRPLLGCVWDFPTAYIGLAFVTTSLVIHEMVPIILMSITNLSSLYTLYKHGRTRAGTSKHEDPLIVRKIPAERRAAKVILALITLFIVCWGTSFISINHFNFNGGQNVEFLFSLARFTNSGFIALSPVVLAFGHRRIRAVVKAILAH
ncbi:bombesin receptor subtype-3-like isoform X1 [Arapaima gigas]